MKPPHQSFTLYAFKTEAADGPQKPQCMLEEGVYY